MKNWAITAGRYLRGRYVLFILGAWLVFLMEFLSRTSASATMQWSYQHIPAFLFNAVLLTGLLMLFSAVTGRTRWAYWIVFLIAFILSLVSGVKLKILGVPFLPWDLVLTGEGGDMTQYIKNIVDGSTVVGLLVYIGASIGLLYLVPGLVHKIRGWERVAYACAALLVLAVIYFQPKAMMQGMFGIEEKTWDQKDNILSNGLLLSTLLNLDEYKVSKVEGYDEEAIAALVNRPGNLVKAGDTPSSVKPNIIVVLSEAFWDPTIIPGAKFSKDPIPGFHKLAEKYPSGWLLSPQYGGGTANVEFEVLTGNSMRFLPQGSVAYNSFIDRPIDSLASIAARQGYTTAAISPIQNWFFNSRKIYEYFGFSKFISIEFFNQVFEGPYIADDEVANNIISESTKSSGPDMIFANTMQNHFHFWPGKFKENTIKVEGVGGQAKGFLETLAQGLIDADRMLLKLVDHYSQSGEPTVIVFFGDHLPALGDDYKGYIDAKYISGKDDPDFLSKMYRTPFLVWNNFLPEQKEDLYMSPAFLEPYILEKAQLKGTYYTDYLKELYRKIPVLPPKDHYSKFNINEKDLADYEKLQYDIMFGDQHGYAEFKDQILPKKYVLGTGEMNLTRVTPAGDSGKEVTLTVEGTNLPQLSIVTLNGKPLKTKFVANGQLSATVPADLSKPGSWDIAVIVKDDKESVIAQTPAFKLER